MTLQLTSRVASIVFPDSVVAVDFVFVVVVTVVLPA